MNKTKQTEQKEIGRIKLSDTQELVAFVVDNKKRHFSIVDKGCDELKELAEKWCSAWRSLAVFIVVAVVLIFINYAAWLKWRVCLYWCLLPIIILGLGLLVQFLDAYLSMRWLECLGKVYEKLEKKRMYRICMGR